MKKNNINYTTLSDLAFLTGKPKLKEKLHVGKPNLGSFESFSKRIEKIFKAKYLSNGGPQLIEYEKALAKITGTKHCIAVCNGTIGLELVIQALGLKGEVIVPSFTFIASAHALSWHGVRPVFADIDPKTYCLDPKDVEKRITPKTSAILGVHLWGNACAVEALQKIADKNRIPLFFDAAHALGCTYQGKSIGQFGEAEVFSLHATKFMNAGEGGFIATNNDNLAEKIRRMLNFGFAGYDNVVEVGTNGKMNEISAALGLTNLEIYKDVIKKNQENYLAYLKGMEKVPGVSFLEIPIKEKHNYQYMMTFIDEKVFGLSRDQLAEILWRDNVLVRKYFHPGCHRMKAYQDKTVLPVTEKVSSQVLAFPTGTGVTPQEIDFICQIVKIAQKHAMEIRSALLLQGTRFAA